MSHFNTKKGFAPLLILLIVVVLAGGTYAAVKLSHKAVKVDSKNEMNAAVSGEAGSGSIRALLSLGKDLTCTFNRADANVTMSGTMYLSGNMMRGDFKSKTGTSGDIDSHVLRSGDTMYVWSSNMGTKMTISTDADAKASPASGKSMDLDQKVDYKCVSWSKDDAKFTIPSDVKFTDISAMMRGNAMVHAPGTDVEVKAGVKTGTGKCSMCEQVSGAQAQEECRKAVGC